jgi:hypothetical protein
MKDNIFRRRDNIDREALNCIGGCGEKEIPCHLLFKCPNF